MADRSHHYTNQSALSKHDEIETFHETVPEQAGLNATDEQPGTSAQPEEITRGPGTSQPEMTITQRGKMKATKDKETVESSDPSTDALLTPKSAAQKYRYDAVLWLFGLLFLLILHSLMFGIGNIRGWNADSAYNHNSSNSSMERFLPEPFIPEPGVYKRSDDQASSRWYYWKLKPEDVTAATKLFVWAGYSLHNLSVWFVLYLQHKSKSFPDESGKYSPKYTGTPDKYNLILFGLNAFFHLLHLLNTHTTYDGTAADTSEASSQSSVIVALIVMIFIEFKDRGVFFGYPTPLQLSKYQDSVWMSPVYLMRKYHGYFIYWAAIFTFWYHPMENTIGHAFGFTHTWFFMLQGSLAFTKLHLNRYWRFTLEVWVTIHAGVVAVQTVPNIMGKELWPMFVFGFGTAVILTQLYGLPFWRNMPSWARSIPLAIYIVIIMFAYSVVKDVEGRPFTRIPEVIRIPGIYYLILIVGWLIIVAITKVGQLLEDKNNDLKEDTAVESSTSDPNPKPTLGREILFLSAALMTYVVSVFFSWILEFIDLKVNLIVLTMIYCFSFMLISAIGGSFFLKQVIPMKKRAKAPASE